jgi:ribosomal-protein-alanine N-acetyltransferase
MDVSLDVSLRRLRSDDINEVVEIEREAFSPLWMSTPFKRDLNNRYASYLVACYLPTQSDSIETGAKPETEAKPSQSPPSSWRRAFGRLLSGGRSGNRSSNNESPGTLTGRESQEEFIAGYVSVWYQGEEAHITEIAVREKLRGRGIGELLLIGSLRAAVEYGSKVMTLEARVSNFVAQRLYEKYGFKSVGIRKGYYSDNREDAVIMTTNPIDSEDYWRMFQELQDSYRSRWGEILIGT